jgi:glucan phosphoethanolaminetransferase (alkaline phosphatase superfamily)
MIRALNMQIDRSREPVDPRGQGAQPAGRASAALRLFAAGFALWPLVVYLAAFTPEPHRLVDALAGLLFTLALVALPALLAFRGWTTALFYLALNLLATASLVNLALTGELPSLGAAAVALRTDWNEAGSMLSAASHATLAIALATLGWVAGCIAFLARAPRLPARLASRPVRAVLAAPLLLAFVVTDAGTTYPMSLVTIAHGLREYNAESRHFQRRLVDPYKVTRAAPGEQVVVLVIGESSGASHWQLHGYARPTTPNMVRRQQAGELASFRAHMSTAGMTTYAVPSLLSPFEEINGLNSPPHRR